MIKQNYSNNPLLFVSTAIYVKVFFNKQGLRHTFGSKKTVIAPRNT